MCGYAIRLSWELVVGARVQIADGPPQPDELRGAVLGYAKTYSDVPLTSEESASDVVELFDAVERHIGETSPSLTRRIKRLFKR
jgi:hypothetical protein